MPRAPGSGTGSSSRRRDRASAIAPRAKEEHPAADTTSPSSELPLIQRPAWKALTAHFQIVRKQHLRALFADDPGRGERLALEAVGIYLDYSKNRVTDETLQLLRRLA